MGMLNKAVLLIAGISAALAPILANSAEPTAARKVPLEIKGIRPGMTIGQVAQKIPGFRAACFSSGPLIDTCSYSIAEPQIPGQKRIEAFESFAGHKPNRWVFFTKNDVIGDMILGMPIETHDDVVASLRAKFGKPSAALGGSTVWFISGYSLIVKKQPDNDLDTMIVRLSADPQPKKNTKDL